MTSSTEVSPAVFEDVKAVVVATLGIEDQADDLGPETGLYGNFAEPRLATVAKLIVALRKRFGIEIALGEVVGEVLYTLGGLAAFVESKAADPPAFAERCASTSERGRGLHAREGTSRQAAITRSWIRVTAARADRNAPACQEMRWVSQSPAKYTRPAGWFSRAYSRSVPSGQLNHPASMCGVRRQATENAETSSERYFSP